MLTPPIHDVAVVGGGPAGATAARLLAQGGARVVLLERARLPRYKTCGGGLVVRAAGWLEEAADLPVEHRCDVVEAHFPGTSATVRVGRAEPVVTMVMRSDLDQALVDAARTAGAEVRAPCGVAGLQATRDHVALDTAAGPVRAAFVVAADGAHSATARAAGWTGAPTAVPAIEAEVPVAPAVLARFAGTARFDLGLPEAGYGWVFPKRAHLSIGLLTTRRGPARLRERLARYLDVLGVTPAGPAAVHGHVIPLRPRPGGVARGRVLLAGDAAGLADPLTGEGISHAIASGRLAALALLAAGTDPAVAAARYRADLRADVLVELAIARLLAWVLYRRPGLTRRLAPRLGQLAGEALTEVFVGRQTYRTLLGRPRRYGRLLRALAGR